MKNKKVYVGYQATTRYSLEHRIYGFIIKDYYIIKKYLDNGSVLDYNYDLPSRKKRFKTPREIIRYIRENFNIKSKRKTTEREQHGLSMGRYLYIGEASDIHL